MLYILLLKRQVSKGGRKNEEDEEDRQREREDEEDRERRREGGNGDQTSVLHQKDKVHVVVGATIISQTAKHNHIPTNHHVYLIPKQETNITFKEPHNM